MTYLEIIQALKDNISVYWANSAYKVFLQNGKLYVIYEYNGYMTQLAESEYPECFKGE